MNKIGWIVALFICVIVLAPVAFGNDLGVSEQTILSLYELKFQAYQTFLDDRGARKHYRTNDFEVRVEYLDGLAGSVRYSVINVNEQGLTDSQIEMFFDMYGGRDAFRVTRQGIYDRYRINDTLGYYARIKLGMHKQETSVTFWTREFYEAYEVGVRSKPFPAS